MNLSKARFVDRKCIMRVEGEICQTTDELLASDLLAVVVGKFVKDLLTHQSPLLAIFGSKEVENDEIVNLIKVLQALGQKKFDQARLDIPEAESFFADPNLLNDFVEALYNYWRGFERFLVCYSDDVEGSDSATSPYRVFNETSEKLTHLIRAAYRDIQLNITGQRCRVYRQVFAGPQVGFIAVKKEWPCPDGPCEILRSVPMIRQVLLNPPLIIDPPTNKRTGSFQKVDSNPLEGMILDSDNWLCYPAKVGGLLVHIFFSDVFMELGCSLVNLFELANDDDLSRKPDAVYVFGAPGDDLYRYGPLPIVFFDDEKNDLLVGAVPDKREFGYFGYLKKMVLTLHNIKVMKQGRLPYHGAMVNVLLKNGASATILLIGDTGAGKSETLEAFRVLGHEHIRGLTIIADDMGSLAIGSDGELLGYGTEIGAFVRLDDLGPGFAFGQIDRAIIMSAHKVNARAIIPVTNMANVLKGYKVDYILYGNNYEVVDNENPVVESFSSCEEALSVFRKGTVMAKGTTTASGIGHSYFANPFGPPQYRELHDNLAHQYFEAAFAQQIFVGQIRTRLGIPGWESTGPQESAKALFSLISNQ